jgi:hypothetical protein
MCLLLGTYWVSVSQKTAFFIVTALKTSNFACKAIPLQTVPPVVTMRHIGGPRAVCLLFAFNIAETNAAINLVLTVAVIGNHEC